MNIQDEEQIHKPNSFFIHVIYAVVPNAPGALDLVFYGGLLRRFDCLVIESRGGVIPKLQMCGSQNDTRKDLISKKTLNLLIVVFRITKFPEIL